MNPRGIVSLVLLVLAFGAGTQWWYAAQPADASQCAAHEPDDEAREAPRLLV